MEEAERQTQLAIRAELHRQKRPDDGWQEIYDKVILDIRKEVANELDAAVVREVAKNR